MSILAQNASVDTDSVSKRIKELHESNIKVTDMLTYGVIKRKKETKEADRLKAKLDFLTKMRPLQFKG